ncbi:MAG: hypothetical protein LBU32_20430 [Clostridiales bacterium]|nr:hypothetical protein [Clostridiales bacterium]
MLNSKGEIDSIGDKYSQAFNTDKKGTAFSNDSWIWKLDGADWRQDGITIVLYRFSSNVPFFFDYPLIGAKCRNRHFALTA